MLEVDSVASYIHDIMDKSMMSWVGVVCDAVPLLVVAAHYTLLLERWLLPLLASATCVLIAINIFLSVLR